MKTIKYNSKYEFVEKNSKFIALTYKVYNKEDVTQILNDVKNNYLHATHYVYAYIINDYEKYDDDNEPSKTAGFQILDTLKKQDYNLTLCIIVRYFGGIKLGTGGLARAYKKACTNALINSESINLINGYKVLLEFDYNSLKKIDYILKNSTILNKEFDQKIKYTCLLTEENYKKIIEYNPIILENTLIELN